MIVVVAISKKPSSTVMLLPKDKRITLMSTAIDSNVIVGLEKKNNLYCPNVLNVRAIDSNVIVEEVKQSYNI